MEVLWKGGLHFSRSHTCLANMWGGQMDERGAGLLYCMIRWIGRITWIREASPISLCIQLLLVELAPYVLYPRQYNWVEEVLPKYDEDRFRSLVGLLKSTFLPESCMLTDRLKESGRFRGLHQFPVELQLAITQYRLQTSDTLPKIASVFGIKDGK